jgi:hypothetical protein
VDEHDVREVLRRAIAGLAPDEALAGLCRDAVELLRVSDVAVTLRTAAHPGAGYMNSGPLAEVMTELQFMLGEGPAIDAYRDGQPVLVADLEAARARWRVFTPAALEAGAAAVFAFPLQVGAIRLGTLCLFRLEPGDLDGAGGVNGALAAADVLLAVVLSLRAGSDGEALGGTLGDMTGHRTVVHQATGVIAAQLGIPVDQALLRLRAHAFADGRTVADVAGWVVNGTLRFDEEAGDP